MVKLNESFDAAQFVRFPKRAVAGVRSRAARPIFCGGTGLYFRALFDGLGDSPPGEDSLRAELEATPMEAFSINSRRKICWRSRRWIAKSAPSGSRRGGDSAPRPIVSSQSTGWNATGQAPANLFCVTREVDDLNTAFTRGWTRVFEHGLVAETESLSKRA
ncbi:MAG: hypothetical protein CM1200mP29_12820 [Verrucomicrobiota bacterium]|nr:MAG: hypothetical protein CM1200mP29_12820 [Verrucomicrobiota bacterium]